MKRAWFDLENVKNNRKFERNDRFTVSVWDVCAVLKIGVIGLYLIVSESYLGVGLLMCFL